LYNIIYQIVDDVQKALTGLLEPVYQKVVIGHAEVRAVFRVSRVGSIAGCYVTEGVIERNSKVTVVRDLEVLFDGNISSLKRFQEDVREVRAGYECGIGLEGFGGFAEGDILEAYREERV
jgi:translation initiation factor IF-2